VEESSSTAPLPFLEGHIDYAITPKLFTKQSLDLFYLEYKRFKGHLLDARIGLEYNIWKHFGLGSAFNIFSLNPVHFVWFSLRLRTPFPSRKWAGPFKRLSRIICYVFAAIGIEIATGINDFCQE